MAIELTRDFPSLDRVRLAVFATGCALHVSALLLTLAGPTRRDQLQGWLDELVELAKSPNGAAAQQLNASIEAAPEAGADDSNVADYYVMRALSVVSYAAQTWTDDNPAQYAQWSADEAVDLMREITFTLGDSAPPLEELEVAAQWETDALAPSSAAPTSPGLMPKRNGPTLTNGLNAHCARSTSRLTAHTAMYHAPCPLPR